LKNCVQALGLSVCLTVALGSMQAQSYVQYGSGASTSYSFFNPLIPVQGPRIPVPISSVPIVIPRGSVIPPLDYLRIQSSVPSRAPVGPPELVSSTPVPARSPVLLDPTLSFEGIQQTLYTPPSTNIAAGPSDVIQIVNSTVSRYDKTGQLTNTTVLADWFGAQGTLICSSGFAISCIMGDVTIRYDQMQGRFVMTLQAKDDFSATSYFLISVSNGATYASGWKNWVLNARFDGTTLTPNWADFPQIGMDNDAVYLTANMFGFANGVFQYAKIRILKKSDLYNPAAGVLPYQDLFNLRNEDGTPASTLQAPHLRGKTRAAVNSVGYLMNTGDTPNSDYITLWKINSPTSNAPTATRVTLKNIWKYSYPVGAPQFGSTLPLETGPASYGKVVMRDGLLFGARNTGYTDAPTTVTYDVVDPVASAVTLQYRWVGGNFFYPAFDLPASNGPGSSLPNNLILGTTTGVNGLTYAGVTNLKAGLGAYDFTQNGVTAKWGDYNGAGIDPVLGGMWVSGEFAKAKVSNASVYGTWNAYFPWTTSPTFTDVPSTNANFSFMNVMKLWNITKGCSATESKYCLLDVATREASAVFIIRALYGEDFTYPNSPYFTDIPATFGSFKYIQKFRELGLTKGCKDGNSFCPIDPATREAAAIFVIRAKMRHLFPSDDFPYPAAAYFTDVPSTDPNFSYIQKFREMGITLGCSATQFCPATPLTREQLAVFIVRAFLN
jgi:hypothetical protein